MSLRSLWDSLIERAPLRRFVAHQGGGVLVIFTLTLPVLLTLTAFGVEYSFLSTKRDRMQIALDAGTLAATKALWDSEDITDVELEQIAERFFAANLQRFDEVELECEDIELAIDREEIAAQSTVSCTAPTSFGKLFATPDYDLSVASANNFDFGEADVAFMLDTTGSMGNEGRMTALKDAMESAIEKLIAISRNGSIRLAIAPYSAAVNAGSYADAATDFFNDDGDNCVTERTGDEAFTDAPPDTKPFRDDNSANRPCPSQSILPLTDNADTLYAKVESLSPNGFTAGHLGIAWSWYLVSPRWRNFWPAGAKPKTGSSEALTRAVVLMTDGRFNTQWQGSTLGSSFDQARAICENMKLDGVTVFSVVFNANSETAEEVMRDCASDPSMFFNAGDNDELLAAYDSIVNTFRRLLLTDSGGGA